MAETINKKDEVTGTVVLPSPVIDITIEGQDAIIKGIDESISNFTNQITNLQAQRVIEVARKDALIDKGIITQTEKSEVDKINNVEEETEFVSNETIGDENEITKNKGI